MRVFRVIPFLVGKIKNDPPTWNTSLKAPRWKCGMWFCRFQSSGKVRHCDSVLITSFLEPQDTCNGSISLCFSSALAQESESDLFWGLLLWYVASATSDGGDGGCRISWFSNAVLYCVTTGELTVRMTRGRYGSFMTSHKYLPLLVVGKAGSDKVAYDTSHCPGVSPTTCFDCTGRKKTGLKMPLHRARMSLERHGMFIMCTRTSRNVCVFKFWNTLCKPAPRSHGEVVAFEWMALAAEMFRVYLMQRWEISGSNE